MKKLLLILATACLLMGCSNEKKIQISGTLTEFGNPDEPTMLYLKTRNAEEQLLNIDSTFIADNGTFVLKGKSAATDVYFLADRDDVFVLRIFVDPGNKIKITGTATNIPGIVVEGSTTHNLYNEYVALLEPLKEKQEHIREEYYSISYNLSIPEEKLVQMQEELIAKFEQVEEDAKIIMKDFIVAHPSSIVAAYLLYRNTQTSNDVAEIEEKLQLLNPEMNNKFVMLVKDRLERVKGKAVGATFPTIELPDPDGKIISVESLRGKYVFVDFWASWCRPCLGEIPSLKKVYEKFHDKGFEILSISLDDDKTAWKNGITTHELNWLHVSDLQAFNSPVAKKLAVSYVPHTFLLDPNGVILAVDLRGEELEIKLTELIP